MSEATESNRSGVDVVSRRELTFYPRWRLAFASQHKDHRYYELVEDTIHPEFKYRYFVVRDCEGTIAAIQPFFMLDVDLLLAISPCLGQFIDAIRIRWPRFMVARAMMVGCVAGEAHLDDGNESVRATATGLLAMTIEKHARALGVQLIVLKEFPRQYREAMACFTREGFNVTPSMPMTRLNIAYANFEDYMRRALNSDRRRKLRKTLQASESDVAIDLHVTNDVSSVVDEIYPLYLQVYERSKLRFEKLTKEYFCQLGRMMPDRVRFFVWRQSGTAVAFGECMVHGDTIFAEYLGLDYRVAHRLHLYHRVFRDLVSWAIENGFTRFQSTSLGYEPKLRLGHRLVPIDLYVKHTSPSINTLLSLLLPLLGPTRYHKVLKKFPNYSELWRSTPSSA